MKHGSTLIQIAFMLSCLSLPTLIELFEDIGPVVFFVPTMMLITILGIASYLIYTDVIVKGGENDEEL